jgi:hypothetical protein
MAVLVLVKVDNVGVGGSVDVGDDNKNLPRMLNLCL